MIDVKRQTCPCIFKHYEICTKQLHSIIQKLASLTLPVVCICFPNVYEYCLLLQLRMVVVAHFDFLQHASCLPIPLMNIHHIYCHANLCVRLCLPHFFQACVVMILDNGVSLYGLQIFACESYGMCAIKLLLHFLV